LPLALHWLWLYKNGYSKKKGEQLFKSSKAQLCDTECARNCKVERGTLHSYPDSTSKVAVELQISNVIWK